MSLSSEVLASDLRPGTFSCQLLISLKLTKAESLRLLVGLLEKTHATLFPDARKRMCIQGRRRQRKAEEAVAYVLHAARS